MSNNKKGTSTVNILTNLINMIKDYSAGSKNDKQIITGLIEVDNASIEQKEKALAAMHYERGRVKELRLKYDQAKESFVKAALLQPECTTYLNASASILDYLGEHDKSNKVLAEVVQSGQGPALSQKGVAEQRRQFESSLGQQQALLGLQGLEKQQIALDSFSESPGQKFLRERGERALLRNASAIGGVGGGNIRSALNEQGINVAAGQMSDFQNRLAEMSGTGQTATSLGAQLGSNAASNIQSGLQYGGNVTGAGILGAGQAMSSGVFNAGQAGAQGFLGAGQAGAQGILGAGQASAQGVLGAQQASGAISQQLLGTGIGALAGSGALGPTAMGAFGGGAGSGALIGLLSDIRLKTNVIKTGELESGLPWYTWDWTDEGLEIAGDQLTEGVLAHEAQEKFPNAVHKINGVLRVNYERIH